MPEDVTVSKDLGIIEVDSYGNVSLDDALASLKQIRTIMDETGIKLILSDTRRQECVPDAVQVYEFARQLPEDARIALVICSGQPTADKVTFVDDLAYNRGIKIIRLHDREDAIAWLQEQ